MTRPPRQRRPRGRRLALFALCSALWSVCFALHADAIFAGRLAWIPLLTSDAPGPDAFPRVIGFWSDADRSASTLAVGDRLLAAGDVSLAGSRDLVTAARIYAAADPARNVPMRVARVGDTQPATLALRAVLEPWRLTLLAALLFGVGALVYWRASTQPAARLLFLALFGYALHLAYFWGASERRSEIAFGVFGLGLGISLPFAVRAALSFPEDVAARGRVARVAPWIFALAGIGAPSWAFGWPLPFTAGFAVTVGGSVAALVAIAAILVLHWRRTGPIGQRQIKWVVLGAIAAFAPPIVLGVTALARPSLWWLYELSITSIVLLPIAIAVALIRDHLFDVDRLLTAAAGYTVLCVVLIGAVIGLVPRAASAFDGVVDREVSEPALAMAAAFLLFSLRSRVEPWFERRMFPERSRFERGAQDLRNELARCEKPAELFVALGERLEELLAPDSLVVFGRADDAYAPLVEHARAVLPWLALDGPLAEELERAGRVTDVLAMSASDHGDPQLAVECRALEAMGTELLVPVVTDRLEAFLCLGPKRSGRGYGASELSLLQSVADKAADELRRFDLVEVQRDQRVLCDRLRRYVPGALAERLARGRDLPVGERDVTVLFVDIRGYVSIAERRNPHAVFDFVGRYAGALSEILKGYGGTIIDVQGDGLLAVFGAPDPQPQKERMAIDAARDVLAAVPALRVDPEGVSDAIDVGIGIATGRAFVGNLATADRSIWCVVGDTVNLAARCQALTRELDAWLVIDAATHAAAGAPSDLLPLPGVAIRGRRARVDLHRLPIGAPRPPDPAAIAGIVTSEALS